MGKIDEYRKELRKRDDVREFLLEESCLPGPRANLELAFAFAFEGDIQQFIEYAGLNAEQAPQNTKMEFLAFCGTLGLGYHLAEDDGFILVLRERASDPRWRVREAVALGLQRWGREHPESLIEQMFGWATGTCLERRAAVASVCEPEVLKKIELVSRAFDLLDYVTSSVESVSARDEGFAALRKALGYGWSVAVSVHPSIGKPRIERWMSCMDRDIRWVMRQNLRKKRLARMDNEWVSAQRERLNE